ncbi:MAG: glycosyltransferase, partial [Oscillospiraceae bacterium]|nr:glycosyltransferase [Oscillospiraceae bacterium]
YHYDMPCFYDEEILRLGGRITKLTVRQDNNLPKYLRQLDEFFARHPEYKVVHGHYSGFGMFYNPAAKKHGVPVRAGHSHNTNYEKNLVGRLDRLMSHFFVGGLTHRFACGQQAGQALYRGKDFVFLPNGVDAAAFAPNAAVRAETRSRLGIEEDETVYGHIGRFTQQKNHTYLLDIFAEIAKRQPRARLLLLGEGPLLEEVKAKAAPLGDRVIFAGVQADTKAYYNAMDAFLLPSLFEGLPVVLAEAQAAGLPCFVSDTVDKTADFGCGMQFLPLGQPDAWADAVLASPLSRYPDALEKVRAAGYDIRHTAAILQQFYLDAYQEG